MKRNDLFEAFGWVDGSYVSQTDRYRKHQNTAFKKTHHPSKGKEEGRDAAGGRETFKLPWPAMAAGAVCLAVVILTVAALPRFRKDTPDTQAAQPTDHDSMTPPRPDTEVDPPDPQVITPSLKRVSQERLAQMRARRSTYERTARELSDNVNLGDGMLGALPFFPWIEETQEHEDWIGRADTFSSAYVPKDYLRFGDTVLALPLLDMDMEEDVYMLHLVYAGEALIAEVVVRRLSHFEPVYQIDWQDVTSKEVSTYQAVLEAAGALDDEWVCVGVAFEDGVYYPVGISCGEWKYYDCNQNALLHMEDAYDTFDVELDGLDAYYGLLDAYSQSDGELAAFLEKEGYVQMGVENRTDLSRLLNHTIALPIPSLGKETPRRIHIQEHSNDVTFEFADMTLKVAVTQNPDRVARETVQLGRIEEDFGYKLYFGGKAQAGGVCTVNLVFATQDHLVQALVQAEGETEAVSMLETLTFRHSETGAPVLPEEDDFWHFDQASGTLYLHAKKGTVSAGGYMPEMELPWAAYSDQVRCVVIEEGVAYLEPFTVRDLPNLERVELPNSLIQIAEGNFQNCGMETLTVPASVKRIGANVATECYDLTYVSIQAQEPEVGTGFLKGCGSLYNIDFAGSTGYWQTVILSANPHLLLDRLYCRCASDQPYDTTNWIDAEVGQWRFDPYTGTLYIRGTGRFIKPLYWESIGKDIRHILIQEGITGVEEGFQNMENLQNIRLPRTLEEMVSLHQCTALGHVTVPEGITEIDSVVFSGCSSLESVFLPQSLEKIGDSAFAGCTSLIFVNLPENIRRIKDSTFHGCTSLQYVTVPAGLEAVEDNAFSGCDALEYILYLGTEEQWTQVYLGNNQCIPGGVHVHCTDTQDSCHSEHHRH